MTTSKLKNVESTAPKYGDIHNRRHRQHTRDQSATIPLACSSEDSKDSSKGSNDLGAKIKLKRSIRSMFQKDGKSNNVTIIPAKSKKSSITAARSTLAKRFRTSTNLSRVTLPKEVEAHADSTSYVANEATGYQFSAKHLGEGRTWEGQPVPTATPRKDGPDDILPVPILSDVSNLAGSTSAIWPPNQPSATNTINKILERIKDLPPGSKEHLAGLHVAEVRRALRY
jgi:hypothetical protein